MSTQVGVGSSNKTNSKEAAREAANIALSSIGKNPDFALVFCSGKHDPYEFMEGVTAVFGDIKMVGGSALGIITDDFLGYEGFEVGITVFASDTIDFKVFAQPDLNIDEKKAGYELGKKIRAVANPTDKSLMVFYDSTKQQAPPMLNFATYLFDGLQENMPEDMDCAGGGLLADMQLSTCYQFYNGQVLTQNAVAVMMGGKCKMDTTIMHGCKPTSSYLKITKAAGPVIFEIEGRPALEVIDDLLGSNKDIGWKDFALFVTLGLNRGDKFGAFNEKDYANRLTLAVDEVSKALIMFEPDLKDGDEVQLMRRSFDLDYIKTGIEDIKQKTSKRKPLFAFYINCAGRAKPYSGGAFEDAEEVQKQIGTSMPLMGFYSGVEVAKVGSKLQALDWTGVLCILSE